MYQAHTIDNRLNPLTLSFLDKSFELSFRANHGKKMLSQVRSALIIAAGLYVLFAILDFLVLAEGQWNAALVRFVVILPIFILGYIATYKTFFRKRLQILVMFVVFAGGIGLSVIGISYEASTSSDLYLLGPIFPLFWAFIYSGLRFINAMMISLLLIITYNLIYFGFGQSSLVFVTTYNFFLFTGLIIGGLGGYTIEKYYRLDFINQKRLIEEKQKNEKLLLNILPKNIANELKENQGTIAKDYDHIIVVFADLVKFSELSQGHSAKDVVKILNEVFSIFDQLTDKYCLEKIKTIGDSYMATSNLQKQDKYAFMKIADFALEMNKSLVEYNRKSGQDLKLRIGMHVGEAVAGVIGVKKFVYDVWGTTVNIASRMESSCPINEIQVSQAMYELLNQDYLLEPRGEIEMKGFGRLEAFLLKGKKADK